MKIADREYMQSKAFKDALDNATYTDPESNPVTYSDNFIRINITNWTDVKTLDKNLIHASAIANNFEISS